MNEYCADCQEVLLSSEGDSNLCPTHAAAQEMLTTIRRMLSHYHIDRKGPCQECTDARALVARIGGKG